MGIFIGADPSITHTGIVALPSSGMKPLAYHTIKTAGHQKETREQTFARYSHISIALNEFYRSVRRNNPEDASGGILTVVYGPIFVSGPAANKTWLTYTTHGITYGIARAYGAAFWKDDNAVDEALFIPKFPTKGATTPWVRNKGFTDCPNHHVADAWNAARYARMIHTGQMD